MLWGLKSSLIDIDIFSCRKLAAVLPFTKTSYLVIFRGGKHHVGHANTMMPYLYSLGNQTVTQKWWSECNSKNMLLPLFHAIYNLFQLVTWDSHAEHIALHCVAGRVSDCQCLALLEVQKYLGGANMGNSTQGWGQPLKPANKPGLGCRVNMLPC